MKYSDKFLPKIEDYLMNIRFPSSPASLYDPCRYVLNNGGKRFRPILTLLGSGLCGGDPDEAMPAAISIELLHNFTLIHDDIMDEAESRRGVQCVHLKWDKPTAILAGDLLFAEAFDQLLHYGDQSQIDKQTYTRLYRTLLDAVRVVCEGQALDMEFETAEDVDTKQYLDMIQRKTAALVRCSLALGGILAGADKTRIEQLEKLGESIGLGFQIQDDLLDAVADPEKFGKKKGGDIREGKKTFLSLYALEKCNEMQSKELQRVLNSATLSDSDVELAIALFEETGATEQANKLVDQYYRQAVDLLNQFDDSVYKEDLVEMVNFLKNREF